MTLRYGNRYNLFNAKKEWFNSNKYIALDGSKPSVIMDFVNNRYAIPYAVNDSSAYTASTFDLTKLRSATFSEVLTFVTTSTTERTYIDNNGILKNDMLANTPRFSYYQNSNHLLLEMAANNRITRSEEFDNVNWTKTTLTVTSNVVTAPDNTLTMDKIIPNNGGTGSVSQSNTVAAACSYSTSVFAKASDWNYLVIEIDDTTANSRAWFNLSTGTVGQLDASAANATINAYANGIYRCTLVRTANASASANIRFYASNANNSFSTGNGSSGIYIWGAQFEPGYFSSSYIKTTTATATRAIETARFTPILENIVRRSAGTILIKYFQVRNNLQAPARKLLFQGSDGGNSRFALRKEELNSPDAAIGNSTTVSTLAANINYANSYLTLAVCWDGSNSRLASNGTLSVFSGVGWDFANNASTTYFLGSNVQANFGDGYYDLVVLYPTKLSNSALTSITSLL